MIFVSLVSRQFKLSNWETRNIVKLVNCQRQDGVQTKTGSLGVERWIDHARMFNDADGLNRFLMCCNDDSLNAKLFQPYRLFHLKTLTEEFGEYVKREFGVRP